MNLTKLDNVTTMSSLDLRNIVNLVRSDHNEPKIRNDQFIERVEDELFGELGVCKKIAHPQNGLEMKVYELTLEQCLLVGMRESKAVRKNVILKIKELESVTKPKSALEIIIAQAQILLEQERKLLEHDDRLKRIESKQTAYEEGIKYFTVLGHAAYKGVNIDLSMAQQMGKLATKLSKERGILVDRVRDQRFGNVNSYHESVLDNVLEQILNGE